MFTEPGRSLFIAEAGVNHNGSLELALEMVDVAARAGADVVKFQTAIPEEVISVHAAKAAYQKATTGEDGSQLDLVRKLHFGALRDSAHRQLVERTKARNIAFLSTPFDVASLDFLVGELGLDTIKLASGEVTNGPLLLAGARKGCRILLSTGMATLAEVETALGVLAFGLLGGDGRPSLAAFAEAFAAPEGKQVLRDKVALFHCVTAYPAPVPATNLRAVETLREAFGLATGFSDHSLGTAIPIAAVARGAELVEKHFTLDRAMTGPDHAASLEPDELAALIRAIRDVEQALGIGIKAPQHCEENTLAVARRSLVARRAIAAGEVFDETNVTAKRPAGGLSPMRYWDLLGTPASRALQPDEFIG